MGTSSGEQRNTSRAESRITNPNRTGCPDSARRSLPAVRRTDVRVSIIPVRAGMSIKKKNNPWRTSVGRNHPVMTMLRQVRLNAELPHGDMCLKNDESYDPRDFC